MFSLQNHPFAVEAFFKTSLVLTYAAPKDELKHLIPECLELDLFNDQWGFLALALVETKNLRPKGFPEFMGNDFILAGYRIFVRYTDSRGKRLRGLYILKSETNKKQMSFWGNLFTHYNYSTTDIHIDDTGDNYAVYSNRSGLEIEVNKNIPAPDLPLHSPFKRWEEARRYSGPLPFTFTYNKTTSEVLIIEGVRKEWVPKPVAVIKSQSGFLDQQKIKGLVFATAFIIENIPYYWKKGKIELWKP